MKKNWQTKKLNELADFIGGLWTGKKEPFVKVSVLRNTNFRNNGLLNFENIAEIQVEEKQLKSRTLQKGDLILEKSGGGPDQPVGRVVYFDVEGIFSYSNFTSCIRVKNFLEIYSKYLWYFLYSQYVSGVTEKMQKQTTGIRNLIMPDYKNLEIPLPTLETQKEIVAKLDEKFAKLREVKKLQEEALADTEKILSQTLREIFEEGKQKFEMKILGDAASLVRGPFGGSLKKDIFVSEGIAVYEQGNVIDEILNNFRYFITPSKFQEMKRFEVSAGDILMSCSGTIGKFVIIPNKFTKGIINQALLKITPKKNIDVDYLKYALQDYLAISTTHIKGGAIKNIASVKELKQFSIPIPSLHEQQIIVARLDKLCEKVKTLCELQISQLEDIKRLEKAYLREVFCGELN